VQNIYTACNFTHFAIYLPKLIKVSGNLSSDRNRPPTSFFETRCVFYCFYSPTFALSAYTYACNCNSCIWRCSHLTQIWPKSHNLMLNYGQNTIFKWRRSAILNLENWKISNFCHVTGVLVGILLNLTAIGRFLPSDSLNFRKLLFWTYSCSQYASFHPHTKYDQNWIIRCLVMAKTLFSKWRPSAVLKFKNFNFLITLLSLGSISSTVYQIS